MSNQTAHDNLRSRYHADLAEAEKRSASIRAKLLVLDELVAEQRELEFASGDKMAAPLPQPNGPGSGVGQPMPISPTKACLLVINTHGKQHPLMTKDIYTHLISAGYIPKGKHFKVTLMQTLLRLKKSGRIQGVYRDGKWRWRAVEAQTN